MTGEATSETASGNNGCPTEVVTGTVTVQTSGDAEALVGVTEVTGGLYINLDSATDLQFLDCLETVGEALVVKGASGLTSLQGLGRLVEVGWGIGIEANDDLATLDGLESLQTLPYLGISHNPALTSVGVPTLVTIERLDIGQCTSLDGNDSLVEISGFDSLTSVTDLLVQGNPALTSLDGLVGSGVTATRVRLTHNAMLPPDHAQEVADALGGTAELCGNLGEAERCECPPSE